jgi:hypothetical protein
VHRLEPHPVFGGFPHLAVNVVLILRRSDVANAQSKHLGVRVAVAVQSRGVGVEDGTIESHQQHDIGETVDGLA